MHPVKTTERFVEESKIKHSNYYSYEFTEYVRSFTKVVVTCPVHGNFEITPNDHLCGKGCATCGKARRGKLRRQTLESFIEKAIAKHGNTYDYSSSVLVSNNDYINVTCKVHGEFSIVAKEHTRGRGCGRCGYDKANLSKTLSNSEFVDRAVAVHGDKYNYSLSEYRGMSKKVKIVCPIHGIFTQTAGNHILGNDCPSCCKHGFDPNKSASLYILKTASMVKVGITNRKVSTRLTKLNQDREDKFSVVTIFSNSSGQIISDVETEILRELRKIYQQPTDRFDGYTECFFTEDFLPIISRIEILIKERIDALQQQTLLTYQKGTKYVV